MYNFVFCNITFSYCLFPLNSVQILFIVPISIPAVCIYPGPNKAPDGLGLSPASTLSFTFPYKNNTTAGVRHVWRHDGVAHVTARMSCDVTAQRGRLQKYIFMPVPRVLALIVSHPFINRLLFSIGGSKVCSF